MGRVSIVQEEIFDDILIEYLADDIIEIDESQLQTEQENKLENEQGITGIRGTD